MPDPDRSTGSGPATGGAITKPRATPQRAVEPGEVVYQFRFPLTEEMRRADTQIARHVLMWAAVLQSDPARFRATLVQHARGKFYGFGSVIPASAKGPIIYYAPRAIFLRLATDSALTPIRVIAADGAELSAVDAQVMITAAANYRRTFDGLDGIEQALVRRRVSTAFEGLLRESGGSEDTVREALWMVEGIAAKIDRLDSTALQSLVQRDPYAVTSSRPLEYTAARAISQLRLFDSELDALVLEAEQRAREGHARAASLTEAIAALNGFDRAWQLRVRLERMNVDVVSPQGLLTTAGERLALAAEQYADLVTGRPVQYAKRTPTERRILETQRRYLEALREVGALPPFLQDDFDRRIADFERELGRTLAPTGLDALADLLVRVDDGLARGHGHFRALYEELARLLPGPPPYTDEQLGAIEPQLADLVKAYPVLGYRALADVVVATFAHFRQPRFAHGAYPPDWRFAWSLHSDLYLKWRRRTLRAQESLRDEPGKAWLADVLVQHTLTSAGVPSEHFLREVAARRSDAVASDLDFVDRVLLVLTVALFVIPGTQALGLALRAVVLFGEAISLKGQYEHQVAADALKGTGLSSEAPSGWWLVLSVVSLGLDVADVARLMRVKPAQLTDAIERDAVDQLFRQQQMDRRELAKQLLRERRQALGAQLFEGVSKASGVLGTAGAFREGLREAATALVRIGYTRLDEFLIDIRVLTGTGVPDEVLERAFAQATREASGAPVAVRVEDLQTLVRSEPGLRARVVELEGQMTRLQAGLDDVVARGDDAALKAYDRKLVKVQRQLGQARNRVGRLERLLAVVDARIAHLEGQQIALVTLSNEAQLRGFERRFQVIRLLEVRQKNLHKRIVTLRRVKRGERLSAAQRHRFHEDVVSSWLREQGFLRVSDQAVIEVTTKSGKVFRAKVDNLVEVTEGRFRVYDAKWSDDMHHGIGNGRSALTTKQQKGAYLAIATEDVATVRVADAASAKLFGVDLGARIDVEPRVILVLNQREGGLRTLALR